MKCTKCGFEGLMEEFARASDSISCCGATHLRRCPKCREISPCNPLMEEIWRNQLINSAKRQEPNQDF